MEISTTQTILYSAVLVLVGVLILLLSTRWLFSDNISIRLKDFVEAELYGQSHAGTSVVIPSREITGNLLSRLFIPSVRNLGNFFGRLTPTSAIESIQRKLVIAGNPYGLGPREFFGLRWVVAIVGLVIGLITLRQNQSLNGFLIAVILIALGYLLPSLWLGSRVNRRQRVIRKSLPDALDMLSVCASAGLGFDQSLQRISVHWDTPIGYEFGRVISEMEMGLSRRESLRNMADRLDVQELSSFVAFVLQSEQLGMSISDTLHSQAAQMRIERRFHAQEQAQKIPTKMLIPMAFLIFPALLAVILGPAIPDLVDVFRSF